MQRKLEVTPLLALPWLATGAVILLLGCAPEDDSPVVAPPGFRIRFRLLDNGSPLPMPQFRSRIPGDHLIGPYHVSLVPVENEGHALGEYTGNYDPSGMVTVFMPERLAIPGEYKVVITRNVSMPGTDDPFDPYDGRFNHINTPLRVRIDRFPPVGENLDLGMIDVSTVLSYERPH